MYRATLDFRLHLSLTVASSTQYDLTAEDTVFYNVDCSGDDYGLYDCDIDTVGNEGCTSVAGFICTEGLHFLQLSG